MRSILSSLALLLVCAVGLAQTAINPASQIRWPAITGTSNPAGPTWPCTATTYGQPYTNTFSGTLFVCSSSGWVTVTGVPYPGAGIPVSSGSAWLTSLTPPTSAIVGVNDTQTLINKTVDGASPTEIGALSGVTSSIQTQLNLKQGVLTLTTTGTSGAATLIGSTLNIPNYVVGGGAVTSVSNSDSTLTVSPTTGSVIASLNLGHANTWSGTQTFNNITVTGTCSGCTGSGITQLTGDVLAGPGSGSQASTLNISGSTGQVMVSNGSGRLTATPTVFDPITGTMTLTSTALIRFGTTGGLSLCGSTLCVDDGSPSDHAGDLQARDITSIGNLILNSGISGCLSANAGTHIVTGSGSACGSAVSSVTSSDGSLNVSPTTGTVSATLNMAHNNTWTTKQVVATSLGGPLLQTIQTGSGYGSGPTTAAIISSTQGGSANYLFAGVDNVGSANFAVQASGLITTVAGATVINTGQICFSGDSSTTCNFGMASSTPRTLNITGTSGGPTVNIGGSLSGGALNLRGTAVGNLGGSITSIVPTGNLGSGSSVSITGLDATHQVTYVVGSGAVAGNMFVVTFTATRAHTSYCTITPGNTQAASRTGSIYMSANSATSYTFADANPDGFFTGDNYIWNINCP